MRGTKTTCILQKLTETQDADGNISQTWPDIQTFNAVFQALQPSEDVLFDKETVTTLGKLYISRGAIQSHNRSEVTETSKIKIRKDVYKIRGVAEHTGRNAGYTVTLEK